MSTPYDLGWGDPRRGGFDVVSHDIGEGVRLAVRNADVGEVFAELVRRLMAAGWDGPADAVRDDWGYNPRLKRWAEAAGHTKASAPMSSWSDHAWGTAIDLDTLPNPMLARRPARVWEHCNLPRTTAAIAASLGIEWGGTWSEPWDPQHFQIAMTPAQCRAKAAQIRANHTKEKPAMSLTPPQDAALTEILMFTRSAGGANGTLAKLRDALAVQGGATAGLQTAIAAVRADDLLDDQETAEIQAALEELLTRVPAPEPAPETPAV